jgi:hypothetical protein
MAASPENPWVSAVTQDGFLSFVTAPYALVYAAPGAAPSHVPVSLNLMLSLAEVSLVRLGAIDTNGVKWTGGTKLYAAVQMRGIGMALGALGIPPSGYYLFASGTLLGYHAPPAIQIETNNVTLLIGALVGIFGAVLQRPDVVEIGNNLAGTGPAKQLADWVKARVDEHRGGTRRAPAGGSAAVDESLRRAYATLDLTPGASDEDVKVAHRRLVKEHHPDRYPRDPAMQQQATRRTAELNAARDEILNHRAAVH